MNEDTINLMEVIIMSNNGKSYTQIREEIEQTNRVLREYFAELEKELESRQAEADHAKAAKMTAEATESCESPEQ